MRSMYSAAVSFALVFASAAAFGQAYPARPIRMIVAFPPGGSTDALARIISPKLGDGMGQNWVVDNRGGAGGNVGAEIVVRANPDGYTLLAAVDSQLTANPVLYKLPFSVDKDLQPITMLATAEQLLIVHPGVPARTFKEFIVLAKQKPGALNYASAGVGSPIHLAAELLKKRTGIEMTHVAYKGAGPAIAALLAGETQVLAGSVASTLTFVQSGRLRALAITGAKRSRSLPDLPTVAESGYPGFEVTVWLALLAPAGTPPVITERIRSEVIKALQNADVQTAMARQALAAETTTSAELAARIKTERGMWAGIIKDAGIRLE
jgi:tripartite-type tricarboxylate transporter receptor subunit TctC